VWTSCVSVHEHSPSQNAYSLTPMVKSPKKTKTLNSIYCSRIHVSWLSSSILFLQNLITESFPAVVASSTEPDSQHRPWQKLTLLPNIVNSLESHNLNQCSLVTVKMDMRRLNMLHIKYLFTSVCHRSR